MSRNILKRAVWKREKNGVNKVKIESESYKTW